MDGFLLPVIAGYGFLFPLHHLLGKEGFQVSLLMISSPFSSTISRPDAMSSAAGMILMSGANPLL